jgi:hypothetical protein
MEKATLLLYLTVFSGTCGFMVGAKVHKLLKIIKRENDRN